MDYYFIDYENVHVEGFAGYEQLDDKAVICVMYTEQSKNITLDIIGKLMQQNIRLESFKVSTGTKNSLDFQLSTYLGYAIAKNGAAGGNYYIVSKDTGYDNVADFWTKRGIRVKRIINLAGTVPESKTKTDNVKTEDGKASKKASVKKKTPVEKTTTREELAEYLEPEEYSEEILEIFNSYKTKQAISNGLSKAFKDSKRASAVYKKLKTLMKEKNKT